LLDERRRALLVRYRDMLAAADADIGERAVELVDLANGQWDARVLTEMSESDAHVLDNIVGAIRRLDRGDYGVCASCGRRIARGRLAILPEAAECAQCATFAEERRPRWIRDVS
jgi:RNA polymerase-binding transcription factor DksA